MRRLAAMFCASLVLAGLLLVPLAAGASALTASAAGFACDPHGTTGGSPTTTLSTVRIDTTTPANSTLNCLFRGTRLPLSTGGACSFDGAAFHVDFSRRTLLPVNNNTNLICSGATSITLRTDLSITKDDGRTTAVPGMTTTYTITVKNNGTIAANGASVADTFTAPITADTYTSVAAGGATGNTASGSGNIADTLNLPGGASVTYTVAATIDPSATGSLANTATVTAPAGTTDNVPANNSATDTDTLTPQADLSITKDDGATTAVPGTTTTYSIVVANAGPNPVTGAAVADTFAAPITGVTYASVAAGGATGNTASGTGNIADTLTLPVGASVTYTAAATIGPSATGNLVNTATVTAPSGVTDTNPANNTATDTDTLAPQADLSITKTDNVTAVIPGTNTTYTIAVTNGGPSTVTGAVVSDILPAGTSFVSATNGATYDAGTNTVHFTTGTLTAGGSTSFQVTLAVDPSLTGTLTNTATVSPPAGVTDSTSGNNSATDTDTLTPQADLSVTVDDGVTSWTTPGNQFWVVTIHNAGPSTATGISVALAATFNGGPPGTGTLAFPDTGPGGDGQDTASFGLASAVTGTVVVTATVSASTPDPNAANNIGTDTDTVAPAT